MTIEKINDFDFIAHRRLGFDSALITEFKNYILWIWCFKFSDYIYPRDKQTHHTRQPGSSSLKCLPATNMLILSMCFSFEKESK